MFTPQQENRIKELIREVLREQTLNDIDEVTMEFFKTIPDIENHYVSLTYDLYVDFCKQNNAKPLTKQAFGTSVKNYYNVTSKVTTVDNKSVRIYTR